MHTYRYIHAPLQYKSKQPMPSPLPLNAAWGGFGNAGFGPAEVSFAKLVQIKPMCKSMKRRTD